MPGIVKRGLLLLTLLCASHLAPPAAAADGRWTMVRTNSMTVIGDQSAAILGGIAVQLEQFRAVVAGLIHNADRPPALPTVVYVFGTRRAMQPYVPLAHGRPAAVAGFFQRDPDMNAIVLTLEGFDESAAVAYHEFTHLLVGNAVRSVPVWVNEGLAEYYSTYRLTASATEAEIGRPPAGRLALLRNRSIPIAELIAVDRSSELYNEGSRGSIYYAGAWALTHYLLTQMPGGGAAINKYVAEWAEGRAPHEAFFAAFEASPAEFDKRLRAYVQRSQFSGTRFTFKDRVAAPAIVVSQTLTAGEADAWLGDLQRRVGREAEAAPRVDGAVMAEPGSAVAHRAAGLLRLSQERTSEGLRELERAAALAPDDFLTQYLHGTWLLRTDLSGSVENATLAAAALRRAISLDPQSSEAHAWLAYAQMQRHETLPSARLSIERAIELAPGRVDYRLRWADVRILQGDYDAARTALTTIAAARTDPQAADGAVRRLATLADYERRASGGRAAAPRAARSIEVPAGSPQPVPGDRQGLRLRALRPGEKRARGLLTRIDCGPAAVRFHLSLGTGTIVTTSRRLDDVELISYLDDRTFLVVCGARPRPESVFLTWIPDRSPSNGRDGVAVAVEFLPKDYVP